MTHSFQRPQQAIFIFVVDVIVLVFSSWQRNLPSVRDYSYRRRFFFSPSVQVLLFPFLLLPFFYHFMSRSCPPQTCLWGLESAGSFPIGVLGEALFRNTFWMLCV